MDKTEESEARIIGSVVKRTLDQRYLVLALEPLVLPAWPVVPLVYLEGVVLR